MDNNKIQPIDRVALQDKINGIAKQYLGGALKEEDVALFVNEAKRVVDMVFDDYIIDVTAIYDGDGPMAIKDFDKRLAFTDISAGYRHSMRQWVENHPIKVEKRTISVDELPSTPLLQRKSVRDGLLSLGIGSIAVVGLRVITGSAWAWLAEMVVFAITAKAYNDGRIKESKERLEKMRVLFNASRNALVGAIMQDINSWLDSAEAYSDELLRKFEVI